jgi:hypothetical protein
MKLKTATLGFVSVGLFNFASMADDSAGRCGIGLDYRSWNGAILRGPAGAIFGVRAGFIRNNRLITGSEFYEQVERAGDYDRNGNYAAISCADLKLEWRIIGADLYGMVTSKTAAPIVLECYPSQDYSGAVIPPNAYIPFRNPATFQLLNSRQIQGVSPLQKISAGQTLVTGGHARVTGRKLEVDIESPLRDYFGLQIAATAANSYSGEPENNPDSFSCPRDGLSKTGPADKDEGGFWVTQNQITYFLFKPQPGQRICFKASTDSKPIFPNEQFLTADIASIIGEGERLFDQQKVCGSGSLAGWTRPMLNEISWMKMFHPFEQKIVIPAGRAWMMDGRYNCWGWDENFNAMIICLEDPSVAENTLGWALGCERIGPLGVWSVYCRNPNLELLNKLYPAYRKLYPPGNPDLVQGQPNWEKGPCHNGNVGKGMDDTPMREHSRHLGPMYSLDMSCMKAWSLEILSRMAAELGLSQDEELYRQDLAEIRARINQSFWLESEGIYRNRYLSGEWAITESPTSFYPWLAGCPSAEQSERLLKKLMDPKKFWGPYLLPTLSRQDPEYGKPSFETHNGKSFPPFSYWRGAIWPPPNFLVYEGLKRYQLDRVASELAQKSVSLWGKSWDEKGWACENYNPETGERTPMSHSHQSWAMLLPLIGIKELLDVEWWTLSKTLRLGTLQPGAHELTNLPIRGHRYSLRQRDDQLELWIDQKPVLKLDGESAILRNFHWNSRELSFEFNATRKVVIKIYTASGNETSLGFEPGNHRVSQQL